MQPAPDLPLVPHVPLRQPGAGSLARDLSLGPARAITAIELRHAGSLRRDAAAGRLPRRPAISAIRDCLRHARHARTLAASLAALALAACGPATPPVIEDFHAPYLAKWEPATVRPMPRPDAVHAAHNPPRWPACEGWPDDCTRGLFWTSFEDADGEVHGPFFEGPQQRPSPAPEPTPAPEPAPAPAPEVEPQPEWGPA